MLTDDEILSLPDDPEEAFVEYEKILWSRFGESQRRDWLFERRYVDGIIAFDEVHSLGVFNNYPKPPTSEDEFSTYFQAFRAYVESISLKFKIEKARKIKSGIITVVVLDAPLRETIHFHISKIRDQLHKVDVPEGKRESLFKKLNAFAEEVDRNRTRVDALMSLAVELSGAAGKIAENLKPVRDLLDPLFKSVNKAKEQTEALPPWKERQQIEAPKKQLPAPEPDLDDDIPF